MIYCIGSRCRRVAVLNRKVSIYVPCFPSLVIWAGILSNPDIDNSTDFFGAGAGSMDVAR
jgi:hypothetical protein